MLHARIQLIKTYLQSLPPSYLTTSSDLSTSNTTGSKESGQEIDHALLRSIQALLSRLPLLLPPDDLSNFNHETLAEKSDVGLVSLLGSVSQGVKEAKDLGRKFTVIEHGKSAAKKLMHYQYAEGGYDDAQQAQEALNLETATRNSLFQ